MVVKVSIGKNVEPEEPKPKVPLFYRVTFTCHIPDLGAFLEPEDDTFSPNWPELGGSVPWTESRVIDYIQERADEEFAGNLDELMASWGMLDWDENVDFTVSLIPFANQDVL